MRSASLGDALGGGAAARRPAGSGARARPRAVRREVDCDWTSGSFMLDAPGGARGRGLLDERFFIYSEETDLCLRIKRAGWEIRHLPQMTILHHAEKAGINPKMTAQDVYTRMQYSQKHYSPAHRGSTSASSACATSPARCRSARAVATLRAPPGAPCACSSSSTRRPSASRPARASPSGPPWRQRLRCAASLPAARRSGPARRRARARSRRRSARRRGRPRGEAAGRCAGRAAGAEPRPGAPVRARAPRSTRRSP